MDFWEKLAIRVGIPIASLLLLSILFRVMFVNFVDNYELGYQYNTVSGELDTLGKQGYIVTWPIVVKIHTIDLRPTQVSINANARVLNAKLVQFNPAGWKLFVSWHGRGDYSNDGQGNLNEILKSYAYDGSGKSYPFLKVLRELKPDDEKKDTLTLKIDTTKIH